jgi:hypothetical protein
VDGVFSEKTVSDFIFHEDSTVMWKKLQPVTFLKVKVKVKDE